MKKKYYVVFTEKFMSALCKQIDGRIDKCVIECDNYNQADEIYTNAIRSDAFKYVRIYPYKPYFPPGRYNVSDFAYSAFTRLHNRRA